MGGMTVTEGAYVGKPSPHHLRVVCDKQPVDDEILSRYYDRLPKGATVSWDRQAGHTEFTFFVDADSMAAAVVIATEIVGRIVVDGLPGSSIVEVRVVTEAEFIARVDPDRKIREWCGAEGIPVM